MIMISLFSFKPQSMVLHVIVIVYFPSESITNYLHMQMSCFMFYHVRAYILKPVDVQTFIPAVLYIKTVLLYWDYK